MCAPRAFAAGLILNVTCYPRCTTLGAGRRQPALQWTAVAWSWTLCGLRSSSCVTSWHMSPLTKTPQSLGRTGYRSLPLSGICRYDGAVNVFNPLVG